MKNSILDGGIPNFLMKVYKAFLALCEIHDVWDQKTH